MVKKGPHTPELWGVGGFEKFGLYETFRQGRKCQNQTVPNKAYILILDQIYGFKWAKIGLNWPRKRFWVFGCLINHVLGVNFW